MNEYNKQKIAEQKERKRRKLVNILMLSFVGCLILRLVLFANATQLKRETKIDGTVLFTTSNRSSDFLILLNNQIILLPQMSDKLRKKVKFWGSLHKESGNDTLNINSTEQLLLNLD
jgi:hypothetical protein